MKKYLTDVVLTHRETYEKKFIEKVFADKIDALNHKQEILDNMPKDHYSHWAKVYTVIKCRCGEEVRCMNFTNTCDCCESDYGLNGDLLASREQWGEETGEHWSECY